MLKIVISNTHPSLTTISRDGKLLPVTEVNIHLTLKERLVHLKMIESTGDELKEFEEVVRFEDEPVEISQS